MPIPDHSGPSLAWLAELGVLLWGHRVVCDVLNIELFANLEPLSAHRYLAYLAREGLVTEIISTNYDCCIEKAFKTSFGVESPPDNILAVIRNLSEYRAAGGRLKVDNLRVLHLYKINGCAEEYQEAKKQYKKYRTEHYQSTLRRAAERIILTERQLQNFRKEHWAEDLFRDRARTCNFLFCGFGSEEPQVRHTALSLIGEFQGDYASDSAHHPEEVAALPNAPFLAAYTEPSFTQLQILTTFMDAHTQQRGSGIPANIPYRVNPQLLNLFSGQDASKLKKEQKALSADLFFQCIFQGAFHRLVEYNVSKGTIFFNWLRRLTFYPFPWLNYLRQVIEPSGSTKNSSLILSFFGTWHDLLEYVDNNPPLKLWRWLWAMRHPMRAENPPEDWYLSLHEDSLLILSTLLILRCLTQENATDFAQPIDGCGLRVKFKNHKDMDASVYLIHEFARLPIKIDHPPIKDSRLVRRIALPSGRYFENQERLIVEHAGPRNFAHESIPNIWIGRQEVVAAEKLIINASTPENFIKSLYQCYAANRLSYHVKLEPLAESGYTNHE